MIRLAIIVPALNEAGNIRRLVERIPHDAAHSLEIIVVDNGSTDGTGAEAQAAGAKVIHEPRRGYGYACTAGVNAAQKADVIIFLDADGSFDPGQIPLLLAPIVDGRVDLVLGTRMKGGLLPGAMPWHQYVGNRMVAGLIRLLHHVQISDLGPFRAIRVPLLETLNIRERTFGYPTEIIVKAAQHHARVVEVPVSYGKRWSGKSKVSGTIRGTLLATYCIFRITFHWEIQKRD